MSADAPHSAPTQPAPALSQAPPGTRSVDAAASADAVSDAAPTPSPARSAASRMFGARAAEIKDQPTSLVTVSGDGGWGQRARPASATGIGVPPQLRSVDSSDEGGMGDGLSALEELCMELEEHASAASTRRSYAGHQKAYDAWCATHGIVPLDATPEQVAQHLAAYLFDHTNGADVVRDDEGNALAVRAAASVMLRLAAIDKLFEKAARPRPGRSLYAQTVVQGIRRRYGVMPVHAKQPVLLGQLRQMVVWVHREQVIVLRDIVMRACHERLSATPGQLARLSWEQVELRPTGTDAYVTLPPSRRGGPEVRHRLRASTVAARCPVRALHALRAAESDSGPVLRGPTGRRLTRQAIDKRLRALAAVEAISVPGDLSLKAARDVAMLTTGWFAALRRSNLVALRWSDLRWHESGEIRIYLRRTKTDQIGEGAYNWLPLLGDDVACPATALTAWRERVAAMVGGDPVKLCPDEPVFPAMNKHDQVKRGADGRPGHLDGAAVNELVRDIAIAVGVAERPEPGQRCGIGGHSLRAGFVTQAVLLRIPLIEIAKVTHHKDLRSLGTYHRPHDSSQTTTITAIAQLVA